MTRDEREEPMLIFGGSASPKLTRRICDYLHVEPGRSETMRFSEGNLFVRIHENVRGRQVYLVQSTAFPANDNFMELLFWIDAFRRSSAASVTAVVPYFSYAKGDKKDEPRVSIRARVCADAIEAAGDKSIVIRTVDLGADKYMRNGGEDREREGNPVLGLRSIRFALAHVEIFKAQLRAILRASVLGNASIMFPLITKITELRQAKWILAEAMEDLDEDGVKYRRDIPVGIMIETPSAVAMAGRLAKEVDFFSIGTNDLIQYTLAVDRSNERVASLYTGADPAVIRFVRDVIRTAARQGVECCLCGEMAGDPAFTLLLTGLGLRKLSMAPNDIPEIKQVIRKVTIAHAEKVTRKVLTMESDREIHNYLRDELRKVLPEIP